MPAVIPFAVSAIATAAGATPLIAGLVSLASSAIIGSYQQKQAKKKAREQYNAAQVDRMANVVTTTGPRELVLGRVRKGGAVAFRGSYDQYKQRFMVHLALAAHEIDAIEQIYFNDQPITIDANGYVLTPPYARPTTGFFGVDMVGGSSVVIPAGSTSVVLSHDPVPGSVSGTYLDLALDGWVQATVSVSGRTVSIPAALAYDVNIHYQYGVFNYFARVWWDLGAPGSVADPLTKSNFNTLWTDLHRGEGIAKLIVEFVYDDNAFPSGIPTVTAQIRGAKVYDPRTATTAWSDNPALLARHVYQHPYFGKATVSAAEDTRFIAAANACDTSQDYVVAGVTSTRALYHAALVATFGSPAADVLDDLTQAMAGMWAFAGGELYIRAGVYTAPVMTFTDADLAVVQRKGDSESQDQLSISVHRERAEKFNVVNLRIWDEEQDYKQVPLTPVKGTALITRDGEELAQEVTLTAVSYSPQAQHIAAVMMRDARDPLTVEVPLKMRAYPVEIFDTVQLTLARYGWSAKTFVVMSRVWDQERGVIRLTMKETAAAIFTPDAAFQAEGYAPNTSTPSPWDIQPPTISDASIYSGTDELVRAGSNYLPTVRVTWPALGDESVRVGGHVDVRWLAIGENIWHTVTVPGAVTDAVLVGPQELDIVVIQARTRNGVATSDWSLQVTHQVVGKSEPPPDVATFTIDGDVLRWTPVEALDLAGYRVRFNYGQNSFWGSGAVLHEGLLTSSPYTLSSRPAGIVTLLIKAVDTSGNESANAAAIVTDLGDVQTDNILFSYAEAPDFAGTITGGTVSAGVLQADALDRFYGDDAQSFYDADGDPFYPASTYGGMTYEWDRLLTAAGLVLLDHTIVASDFTIEYRRDSQDAFYGTDLDQFYGTDADLFYGATGEWQTWPGQLSLVDSEILSFRITTAAGPTQGQISEATVILDVPDLQEELDDVVIAAAGTRLPITLTYTVIANVQLTVQNDGNGGTSVRIEDKDATLGPLVKVLDASGTPVDGLVDATVKGYFG